MKMIQRLLLVLNLDELKPWSRADIMKQHNIDDLSKLNVLSIKLNIYRKNIDLFIFQLKTNVSNFNYW